MKKLLVMFLCLTMAHVAMKAQNFKWGIRGGISTPDVKPADFPNPLKLKSTMDSFNLKVTDANYGYHFGAWARVKLVGMYIQPEVVFNSSKVKYSLKNLKSSASAQDTISERFNNLDIPVMIGFKLGSFRVNAGPVAHFNLSTVSGIDDIASNYEAKFKSATFGYQAGLGLDFGSLGIDIRYEGNFKNFGSHINFGGTAYEFSTKPARFLVTAAYAF
jgi:hypothetical protein